MVIEVVAHGAGAQAQGLQEFFRAGGIGLIRRDLVLVQGIPFTVEALQGFFSGSGALSRRS
jgi:hypothetical protein